MDESTKRALELMARDIAYGRGQVMCLTSAFKAIWALVPEVARPLVLREVNAMRDSQIHASDPLSEQRIDGFDSVGRAIFAVAGTTGATGPAGSPGTPPADPPAG